MQIASGKVVGGRIELDAELPEGASVTVITRDADETFEVDEATERMLLSRKMSSFDDEERQWCRRLELRVSPISS